MTSASSSHSSPALAAAGMLCWREIVRFFRQRNRLIGAFGQPLIFWLLFGAGLQQYFRIAPASDSAAEMTASNQAAGAAELSPMADSGQPFLEYFFPGVLIMMVLFTAIFTTISVIEDRREGFLQSVLVAPLPRWSMVLGKVLGGALIALLQGLIFLLFALFISVETNIPAIISLVGLLFMLAVALTSMGLVIAWRMDSTQGFHAIMTLVLMPMWLLSGAFFPVPPIPSEGSWGQILLYYVMRANPLTYGVAGARRLLFSPEAIAPLALPSVGMCWMATIAFALAAFFAAWKISAKRTTGDLL